LNEFIDYRAEITDPRDLIPTPTRRKKNYRASESRKQLSKTPEPTNKKFICKTCNARFKRKQHLTSHEMCHSTQGRPFACSLCPKTFKRMDYLKSHLRERHTKESSYTCDICSRPFSRAYTRDIHIRKFHATETTWKYKCSFCNKNFMTTTEFENHISSHTKEKPFTCEECGFIFQNKSNLRYHVTTIHGNAPYRHFCDICNKGFDRLLVLNKHKETHLPLAERTTMEQCPFCEKQLSSKGSLQSHLKLHLGEEHARLQCDFCVETYATLGALQKHKRLKHSQGSVMRFKCDQCHKSYATSSGLKEHIVVKHMPDISFACTLCGKILATKTNLRLHKIYVHTRKDERPHSCTFCEKTYKSKPALKQHIAAHTMEKAVECQFCRRSFNNISNLRQHVKNIHTKLEDRERFHCTQCRSTFSAKSSLRSHVKLQHDGDNKEEHCGLCDKVF